MSTIKVIGGKTLNGEIKIQGSKNAALPILAATILNKGITILRNCPKILDVFHMIKILEELGSIVTWEGNTLTVDTTRIYTTSVSEEFVSKMRSSILFLGSLLGRNHEVTIAQPGGCSIGERKIDYHLNAIQKMNITYELLGKEKNIIHCKTDGIVGNDIYFKTPSVGATQNVILAAVRSKGVTRIFNAAREPEVTELCNYLLEAGAKIHGKGTSYIEVEGVEKLHDVEFTLSPDRIVAGTYMTAVAATGGEVVLRDAPYEQLDTVINMLRNMGCDIKTSGNSIAIRKTKRLKKVDLIATSPYPGFPTDMQSQFMSVLCLAEGKSTIVENIFDKRYHSVHELRKMGASIEIVGNKAIITGIDHLHGAVVNANDLRCGASLVVAGLAAKGVTMIEDITHIERGYEDICRDLAGLGANIQYGVHHLSVAHV